MATIVKPRATRTKRTTDVPIVPLTRWKLQNAPRCIRISRKLRHFRGTRPVALAVPDHGWDYRAGRGRLLWSAPIRGDKDCGVVVAFETWMDRFFYGGEVAALGPAGEVLGYCVLSTDREYHNLRWHHARLIETAKAGLAALQERSAPAPKMDRAVLEWLAHIFVDFEDDDFEEVAG
jgi:hypothetical protein